MHSPGNWLLDYWFGSQAHETGLVWAIFRLYRPEKHLFDKNWVLSDIEKVKRAVIGRNKPEYRAIWSKLLVIRLSGRLASVGHKNRSGAGRRMPELLLC